MKYAILLLLFLLTACTLNSSQEKALNTALVNFIDAKNKGDALTYASLTYTSIFNYYHAGGKESLLKRFGKQNLSDDETTNVWKIPFLKQIKKKNNTIQVFYSITLENDSKQNVILIAISENSGENWLFAESKDYFSENFPTNKRLFSEEDLLAI